MFSRILTPVLLIAALGACHSWRPASTSPDPSLGTTDTPIRVTLIDGRRFNVARPIIAGDTLRAWDLTSGRSRRAFRDRRAVPIFVPVAMITAIDSVIRLTLIDDRSLELTLPTIAADTLRAWDSNELRIGRAVPVTVPVSEIKTIEARHHSAAKTAGVALGVPVALGAVAFVAILGSMGDTCWFVCSR